jgi:alpha-glucosidase
VVDGYPGQFVVIARQAGKSWYVGAMNGDTARTAQIPLGFLGTGRFRARIWSDAEEVGEYPDRVWVKEDVVDSTRTLPAKLAPGGGFVARIVPE